LKLLKQPSTFKTGALNHSATHPILIFPEFAFDGQIENALTQWLPQGCVSRLLNVGNAIRQQSTARQVALIDPKYSVLMPAQSG
jgi:hypothetical protein